jgi:hypothetical protein
LAPSVNAYFNWTLPQILLIGFILTLSSTAVAPDGIARAWPEPHPCRPADRWRAGGAGYRGCAGAGFCTIGYRCVAAMAIIAGVGGDCISDIGGVAGMDWRLPTQIYAKLSLDGRF